MLDTQSALRALGKAPKYCERPFKYLAGQNIAFTQQELTTFDKIEKQRERTANLKNSDISIYYSPKPSSTAEGARPTHGDVKAFDAARIAAHTSISTYWGRLLYLIAADSGAEHILELGTCAGISGCYLSTPSTVKSFTTIEASEDLCAIARHNLASLTEKAEVKHGLFDDVLDQMLPSLNKEYFSLVWIDGHHEKVATLHYFRRLRPWLKKGAIVLFDDISWSRDMRECWEELMVEPGFTDVFDLKTLKGMCIWQGGKTEPKVTYVAKPMGRIKVSNPTGWSD